MLNALSNRRFVLLLAAVSLLALFSDLGHMDVVQDNEGQRAAPAAEMYRSGDYVIPTLNGEAYLNKPPLLYWAIALLFNLTGDVSALTARLPTALCGFALVWCVYLLIRREAGEATARRASLIVLASPYLLQRARLAQLDIPLTLAVFLAIMAFRAASRPETSPSRALLSTCGAGVALGAGIMLKGPAPLFFLWAAALGELLLRNPRLDRLIR